MGAQWRMMMRNLVAVTPGVGTRWRCMIQPRTASASASSFGLAGCRDAGDDRGVALGILRIELGLPRRIALGDAIGRALATRAHLGAGGRILCRELFMVRLRLG